MRSERLLRNIYIAILLLLFGLIISTPLLINQGIVILDGGMKEIVEAGMLFLLVSIGFTINYLYKRRLRKKEKQLNETLSYIGAVNLQVDQIKSIIDMLSRYPETKKDFRYLFEALAQKALSGVNSEWVLFRIIDLESGNTLTEYTKARGIAVLLKCEISNKDLLDNKYPQDCQTIVSTQENLSIKVFCVLPVKELSDNQEVLLKAIVNNLCMLYLIFDTEAVNRRHGK